MKRFTKITENFNIKQSQVVNDTILWLLLEKVLKYLFVNSFNLLPTLLFHSKNVKLPHIGMPIASFCYIKRVIGCHIDDIKDILCNHSFESYSFDVYVLRHKHEQHLQIFTSKQSLLFIQNCFVCLEVFLPQKPMSQQRPTTKQHRHIFHHQ